MTSLVVTLIGSDRPGLVESVASVVSDHGANWVESRMAHLAGEFAGILRVEVEAGRAETLVSSLKSLSGLNVTCELDNHETSGDDFESLRLDLVGNDRPGIVRDITHLLTELKINVEEFNTECVPAPMSGGRLFKATASLRLPSGMTRDELSTRLEQLAGDMLVDIEIGD